MCMCMHNRYMNMHIGHYPMLELRCICTIYTCIKSNNDYPGRIQHQYHPKRFRCRVCYDASERPAFVDFSWTFANPLPVTPKVYKSFMKPLHPILASNFPDLCHLCSVHRMSASHLDGNVLRLSNVNKKAALR